MKIKVTEHKSVGSLNMQNNSVRVFVDGDYDYGYFVPELDLFKLLDVEQMESYLGGTAADLDVTPEIAQTIIDISYTPHQKKRVVEPDSEIKPEKQVTYNIKISNLGMENGLGGRSGYEEVNMGPEDDGVVVTHTGAACFQYASGEVVIYAPGMWVIITGGN